MQDTTVYDLTVQIESMKESELCARVMLAEKRDKDSEMIKGFEGEIQRLGQENDTLIMLNTNLK